MIFLEIANYADLRLLFVFSKNIYVISLRTLSNHSRSNIFQLRRPVDHKKTGYFSFFE